MLKTGTKFILVLGDFFTLTFIYVGFSIYSGVDFYIFYEAGLQFSLLSGEEVVPVLSDFSFPSGWSQHLCWKISILSKFVDFWTLNSIPSIYWASSWQHTNFTITVSLILKLGIISLPIFSRLFWHFSSILQNEMKSLISIPKLS